MAEWTTAPGDPSLWRLIGALVGGGALGLFYFGGLWWTVRRLETTHNAGFFFAGSFIVRTAVTVAGLWLIAFWPMGGGSWPLLVTALAGFILMRHWLTRRLGPISNRETDG